MTFQDQIINGITIGATLWVMYWLFNPFQKAENPQKAKTMTTKTPPFHLVWNPRTGYTAHRHETLVLAETEAQRLARENPGQEFYVLGALTRVIKSDLIIERFQGYDDGIPF